MCRSCRCRPSRPGSDFAVIIMGADGTCRCCGHCIIGRRRRRTAWSDSGAVTRAFDTRRTSCRDVPRPTAARAVSSTTVDSFVLHAGRPLEVEGFGRLTVDIAYGGDFYAFVDADPLELALEPGNDAALIDAWRRISKAVAAQIPIVHPERPDITACYQVLFTSRRTTTGDVKQTILCPPGSIDRSPCGTGDQRARCADAYRAARSGLPSRASSRACSAPISPAKPPRRAGGNGVLYVTPRVTGRAFSPAFTSSCFDPADPLPEGFRIGPTPRREPRLPQ